MSIEGESKGKRVRLSEEMLYALVEAIRWSERIKPSQHVKREVFRKYGLDKHFYERVLTALFYTMLRRQGVLDRIIEEVTGAKPVQILDPWLRAALRVATEILLFHRVGEATKRRLRYVVAGFISKKTHPFVGMYYWRIIDKLEGYKIPEYITSSLEYKYLLPKWFIDRMIGLLSRSEAEQLFSALNKQPLLSVRVNILKTTPLEVIEELTKDVPWVMQSRVLETVLKFPGPYGFSDSKLWRRGYIIIQEEAAAVASTLLAPRPGETVVDMAAAPGGKTEHMAELMGNKGVIYAFDVDELRIKRMRELLERTGIDIVEVYKIDSRRATEVLGEEVADKVLIDPPCTSDGTIAKNPDLRWRIREERIKDFTELQYGMLETGWRLLKPGGRLLYCTCSMLKEENEDLIKKFLDNHSDAVLVKLDKPYSPGFLEGTRRAWPHRHDTIGFFYALLEKARENSF